MVVTLTFHIKCPEAQQSVQTLAQEASTSIALVAALPYPDTNENETLCTGASVPTFQYAVASEISNNVSVLESDADVTSCVNENHGSLKSRKGKQ